MTKELTKGSPFRLIFSFMLPVLIGNIFQQLYNMADTLIVGHTVSSDAMAGVGSTGSITFLIIGFATGLTSGFAVRTSQRFGARDEAGVRKSVAVSLELCILLTAFLMSLAMPLAGPLLRLMQTPEKYFSYAYWYLFVCFGGIGATILYNISAATLRSIGDTKTPLVILVVSAVLNVGLDLLFIVVFKMKYTGAAAATVISQFVAGVGGLIYMLKAYPILRPHRSDWKSFRLWGGHIALGLPMALQFSITAIGSIMLQSANNALGTACVAAFTSAMRIKMFFLCPLESLGMAMATFSGQNYGAGKPERIWSGIKASTLMMVVYTAVTFLILMVGAKSFALIFVDPSEVEILEKTELFLHISVSFFPMLGLLCILRYTIQGVGYTNLAMFSGVSEMIARILVSICAVPAFGFIAVCFGDPMAWVAADLFLIPAFIYVYRRLKRQVLTSAVS